jgi:hypothetical protein
VRPWPFDHQLDHQAGDGGAARAGLRYDGRAIFREFEGTPEHGVIVIPDSEGDRALAELKRSGFHTNLGSDLKRR